MQVINYILAPLKILYDKTYDCLYLTHQIKKIQYNDQQLFTNIEIDENDFILIDNTQPEIAPLTIKRIYPELNLLNQYNIFFKYPTHIIDNIYLGSAFNAASFYTLKNLNIKMILNITTEIDFYYPQHFIYKRYELYDNNYESITKYLKSAYDDIKQFQKSMKGNIFIHCFMGKSRSASIVIYYIMRTLDISIEDAIKYVKTKRPLINPSEKFKEDLNKSIIL